MRAGSAWAPANWFLPQLETYVGVGYDSSAVPVETIDPVLMDMNKISVSLGARWQIIKHLAVSLTSTELFFFDVDTESTNRFDCHAPEHRPRRLWLRCSALAGCPIHLRPLAWPQSPLTAFWSAQSNRLVL